MVPRPSHATRSPRGARPRFGALAAAARAALLALALGAASAFPARADDGPGALPWRVPGAIGYTVDAASFPDSAGTRLEVYLRLRPETLARLAQNVTHEPWIRFTLRLRPAGRRGATQTATQELRVTAEDTLAAYGRVLVVPFRVGPGAHALEVRAEARRHLLPGSGTGRPDVAKVAGDVVVPDAQAGRSLSDLEFVWAAGDSATPRAFRRDGVARLPNPERLYGLYENALRASFAARAPEGGARPWRWVARVLDDAGAVVAARESTGAAAAALDADFALDLSQTPAGGYTLEVKAWQEGDEGALLRRARFSVGWDPETWTRDPGDVADEAHLILGREEDEAFARLHPGEQERALADFWRARDPSPETAGNEARETFRRRVAFANATYGRAGVGRGMFSDMGRVYIRYGEPSEVQRQVMPGWDNELSRVLRQLLTSGDRPVGDLQNVPGADMRPFEVWIYEGEIAMPLDASERAGTPRHLGKPLLFLFIDERMVGDYRLRYSTE